MIVIIDYDTGNTKSVQRALLVVGLSSKVSADPDEIRAAKGLVLPGVGAYPQAMQALKECKLDLLIKEEVKKGKPLLGICLGMQLLLEGSMEYGFSEGLGLIEGICEPLPKENNFPVPHVGWNQLTITSSNKLVVGLQDQFVYFVHSYYADCEPEYIDAVAQYSLKIPAIISSGHVFGIQFHPEKSGEVGLELLKKFKEVVEDEHLTGN